MKFSKENHDLTRQNEKNVKKSQKHDANLQKNSTLYFQIGLILCLLAVYGSLEMRFQTKDLVLNDGPELIDDSDYVIVPQKFKVVSDEPAKPKKVKPKVLIEPKIIENDTPDQEETKDIVKELVEIIPEGKKAKVLDPDDIVVDPIPEDVHVMHVELVPIYPGCEKQKTNDGRRKCMSKKLAKLVQKKFDRDIAGELGLSGRQVIRVNFKINKAGSVEIVNARGTHPNLEKEAKRVVNKAKQMKPGQQGGKPVNVLYSLPIVFDVQN